MSRALLAASKLPHCGTTIFTVMSALAMEHGAVNLGQGFPDFPPPTPLLQALHATTTPFSSPASSQPDPNFFRKHQYAPMTGILPLRQAIHDKINDLYPSIFSNGSSPSSSSSSTSSSSSSSSSSAPKVFLGEEPLDVEKHITVTSGATEALFNAIQAVVAPGDEVIILDPAYDSYQPAVILAGGTPVHVPLLFLSSSSPSSSSSSSSATITSENYCTIDWQGIKEKVNDKTRLLIINSPHNPSGAILSSRDIQELSQLLEEHQQLLVLSDEVYEHMTFDGQQHHSLLRYPQLAGRAFVVCSFGKTYHCTGWKLGYCVAPTELSTEFRKVHQFNTFASYTPSQFAVADMMRRHPEHHLQLPAFYQHKRDAFQRALRAQTLLRPLPVAGGFFQLVDYSAVSDLPDLEFCRWLTIEHGVTAIPLSPFYHQPPAHQRLARLCFAKEETTLDLALQRLQKVPPK